MRIYITNEKKELVELLCTYLIRLVKDKEVDLIINGNKINTIINNVNLEEEEEEGYSYVVFVTEDGEEKIPVLEDTKIRLGKELISFETQSHTTIIEIS